MKAITLHQPWATFLVAGIKVFETRSWNTKFRGKLLIHASKKKPVFSRKHREIMETYNLSEDDFPTEAIVGSVNVVNVFTSERAVEFVKGNFSTIRYCEILATGDYTPGRYAWLCQDAHRLAEPVPALGSQGFWNTVNAKSVIFSTEKNTLNKHLIKYFGIPIYYSFVSSHDMVLIRERILKSKTPLLDFPELAKVHANLFLLR